MKKFLGLLFAVQMFAGVAVIAQEQASVSRDPAVAKKNYQAVISKLDEGGDMLVFANVEGMLERSMDKMLGAISLAAKANPESAPIKKAIDAIPGFLRSKGLYSVEGIGFSAVPLDNGLNDIKLFIKRTPASADTQLWRGLFSGAPRQMKSLDFVPSDAVMVRAGCGEIDKLWSMIKQGIREVGTSEASANLDKGLENAARELGVSLDSLIDSIGDEGVFSLHLSRESKIALPARQELVIPAPSALMVLKIRNPAIIDLITRKLAGEGSTESLPVSRLQVNGSQITTINMPIPIPVPIQPSYAEHKGHLLLGSTLQVVKDAVQASDNKSGIVAQNRFKNAFKDLPMQNNGLLYADRELGLLLLEIQEKMMLSQPELAQEPGFRRAVKKLLAGEQPYAAQMVVINGKDGILVKGRSSMGGSEVIMSTSVAPIGMMAAIAIPSFVKARNTSRQNMCINNLRILDAAKEQWALAQNKRDGDQVNKEEVLQYVKGARMPVCPQGGVYTLHVIGQDPECSIHGKLSENINRY